MSTQASSVRIYIHRQYTRTCICTYIYAYIYTYVYTFMIDRDAQIYNIQVRVYCLYMCIYTHTPIIHTHTHAPRSGDVHPKRRDIPLTANRYFKRPTALPLRLRSQGGCRTCVELSRKKSGFECRVFECRGLRCENSHDLAEADTSGIPNSRH